jgi:hypothetical protein
MLGVDTVGDRRSQAILARNFSMKTGERYEERKSKQRRKKGKPVETDAQA